VLDGEACAGDGHEGIQAIFEERDRIGGEMSFMAFDLLSCARHDALRVIAEEVAAVFPEAKEQRCWNHRLLNILDKVPLKRQAEARSLLTKIPYADTREEAERQKQAFQAWCTERGHADVGRALDRDWERMVTFYQFPREHWKHLRTSNPVESPFAAVRLRTAAAKRFKKVENATAVTWKTLLIAEKTFRRLDAPQLLADVASGAVYVDGVRAVNTEARRRPPPDLIYTLLDKKPLRLVEWPMLPLVARGPFRL
jgi:hypothetical protein